MPYFMASNLTKRGDTFYFRARVPAHLVKAFGRDIVSISLKTRDKDVAKVRVRERRLELDQALRDLSPTPPPAEASSRTVFHLSDDHIAALCARHVAKEIEADEVARSRGLAASSVELDRDLFEIELPALRAAYARGDLSDVYPRLDAFLEAERLVVSKRSAAYQRLAHAFQRALIDIGQALFDRRNGVPVAVPAAAVAYLTLDEVYRCWKKQGPRDPKTARSFEQAFEAFKAHCPSDNAQAVRKSDAVAFRNALLDKGEHAPATIAKQIGFLRAGFQCAVNDDLLPMNPFVGVKVAKPAHIVATDILNARYGLSLPPTHLVMVTEDVPDFGDRASISPYCNHDLLAMVHTFSIDDGTNVVLIAMDMLTEATEALFRSANRHGFQLVLVDSAKSAARVVELTVDGPPLDMPALDAFVSTLQTRSQGDGYVLSVARVGYLSVADAAGLRGSPVTPARVHFRPILEPEHMPFLRMPLRDLVAQGGRVGAISLALGATFLGAGKAEEVAALAESLGKVKH